ncbi:MAG: 2-C-methyl-D-erythritol 4-phosphate cytidylyltransferase [Tissierellia bacterium]|nr:2-C-methyl-D-erythritol 4-phosphate cytidylyltransferase [Tissierellia bacterium]
MLGERIVTAIVTAAGSGTRLQTERNKMYVDLAGKSVLLRTMQALLSSSYIDDYIIVIRKEDLPLVKGEVLSYLPEDCRVKLVYGGDTREESTYFGLAALPEKTQIVVTHDGARPFVNVDRIDAVIEAMEGEMAAILAVPCKDTIKILRRDQTVEATPDRSVLYSVQTPQVFDRDTIVRCYRTAMTEGFRVTDDASIAEILGVRVRVILGDYANIKITTKEDLLFGELLLRGCK